MNNLKELDKVINDPKNHAAIYARISGNRDNNSISSQVQLATTALKKRNLLVYDVYTDLNSAKKLSPNKRKGLSKLLADAKAGCFKTVIIYRLDRLVRRYEDWLEIKNTFSKLGIKLIYSDDSQSFSLNSSQGDFFENLMVMVAEMEPDTISQRASNGRIFVRKQGAYNSGINVPFGYKKVLKDESDSSKSFKYFFDSEPIKLAFVKFIYMEFHSLIINLKKSICFDKNIFLIIYKSLQEALNYIEENLDKRKIPLSNLNKNSSLYELCSTINYYLETTSYKLILDNITSVKYHYLIDSSKNQKRNAANIAVCLKNSIYAGYMLDDSKHPCKGLNYTIDDNDNIICSESLDENAFIKTNNLNGVIPYDIFKTVYSYLMYKKMGNVDRTPNFLLKGTLKCICKRNLLLIDDNYLHCGNSKCKTFLKDDLLRFIVNEVVKDCLSKSNTTIEKFLKTLLKRTELDSANIISLKKKKFEAISNYINSKDESFINYIYDKKISIDSYTNLCSQYRQKISYINSLVEKIRFSNKEYNTQENNHEKSLLDIINKITDYILSNEDIFIPIFSEIIKEVKVKLNNESRSKKGSLQIKYEFTPEKPRNIP